MWSSTFLHPRLNLLLRKRKGNLGSGSEAHMNKLILFIALIIFQAAGLTWGASYLLQLKNGNEVRTSRYWEEGDEIKFYIYGGVAGIQKGFVTRVTISNLDYKEEPTSKGDIEKSRAPLNIGGQKAKESAKIRSSETESTSSGSSEKGEEIDFDYYRGRKTALKEKLEDALQRNREATTRQDQEARESTRKEYLEFSKQIMDLGDELKSKNKGVLPDWWNE
jgi:hypothetical protein